MTASSGPNDSTPNATSFEETMRELELIVADLENGALGLEESMQCYERGVSLLRSCYGILERAEQRIEILTGFDRDGQPELEPFDGTATV